MTCRTVYIGLGANVGDRARTLLEAAKMLDDVDGVDVLLMSRLIETSPAGGPPGQGPYLNGAAAIETTLSPAELLAALQRIEKAMGRDRSREERWGPRSCDLDILLIDDLVIDEDDLTVPHPRMHERLFVLRPLCQIAPDAVHPVLGKTVRALLASAEASG